MTHTVISRTARPVDLLPVDDAPLDEFARRLWAAFREDPAPAGPPVHDAPAEFVVLLGPEGALRLLAPIGCIVHVEVLRWVGFAPPAPVAEPVTERWCSVEAHAEFLLPLDPPDEAVAARVRITAFP